MMPRRVVSTSGSSGTLGLELALISWAELQQVYSGQESSGIQNQLLTDKIFLGIDAGGTFTDFVALRVGEAVEVEVHKTLSTPDAPEQAILAGIEALGLSGEAERGTLHIIHGSTVATNAALEGKNAPTAYVTNYGFGDTLMLGRQTRPALYALEFPAQSIPVPSAYCLETGGRMSAEGKVLETLTSDELQDLVARIRDLAPEAVAINLLFSFLDDSSEVAIEKAIADAGVPVFVSRSSAVLPVYKEYERGIATWLNASLGPVVSGYLSRLRMSMNRCSLRIMQSNGETLDAEKAAESAVRLLLSGPAGGLIAMKTLGEQADVSKIISFDMGGTSTDVALLDGEIATTSEGHIGPYPVAVPMVDMHTIGAGGGSIAYVDQGGMLQVGPRSAGADPGPACYGLGGRYATVTDANLVLGRLVPGARLAGSLALSVAQARDAVGALAQEIALSVEETAAGIISIANEHMAKAIREISVNRGYDPADFVLASFGGAGGLHVCALAEAMRMHQALVPARGGVLSALGMLMAPRGRQLTRTLGIAMDGIEISALEAAMADLECRSTEELSVEGDSLGELVCRRSVDLCYKGQSYTLNVPWQGPAESLAAFRALHERRYGYSLTSGVELVNICVDVREVSEPIQLPSETPMDVQPARLTGQDLASEADDIPAFPREALAFGQQLSGPCVITEYSATVYVAEHWLAEIDALGNLRLSRKQSYG